MFLQVAHENIKSEQMTGNVGWCSYKSEHGEMDTNKNPRKKFKY
jgi:hypothetical protein